MNSAEFAINKNIILAEEHDRISCLIRDAQIEEFLCLYKDNSYENVSLAFSKAFKISPISPEMMKLCIKINAQNSPGYSEPKETARIATPKNPLSLSALNKLTKGIGTVILTEEADFRSCCEAVSSDTADYCIMPVCSSVDGYYPSFSKMIKAYDLKICKSERISKADSDEELQFALLSKDIEIPQKANFALFSFVDEDRGTLPKLIDAFHKNGIDTVSVQSSPLEFNMDRFEHKMEVSLKNHNPDALLFFLNSSLPGHIVLGIY